MKKILIILILILIPLSVSASIFQDKSFFPYDDQIKEDASYFQDEANYDKSCIADGSCSLDQGLNTFVVITKWAMGLLGSVSLLFFVIGGFMWMSSGGNSGRIDAGKKIMINTVIGILIVLTAWLVVQTILTSITDKTLQGLSGDSQIEDLCANLDEGASCRGNLGVCQNGICTEKCSAQATAPAGGGYQCLEYEQCDEDSIIRMYCFGSNSRVCCQAK